VRGLGNPAAFGALMCGCTYHHGGAVCDLGCPDPRYGGDVEDEILCRNGYCPTGTLDDPGRIGWWMCADTARLTVEPAIPGGPPVLAEDPEGGGGWRLRGADLRPVGGERLCQREDCRTGWTLR
jgi:hypothetical protein